MRDTTDNWSMYNYIVQMLFPITALQPDIMLETDIDMEVLLLLKGQCLFVLS